MIYYLIMPESENKKIVIEAAYNVEVQRKILESA